MRQDIFRLLGSVELAQGHCQRELRLTGLPVIGSVPFRSLHYDLFHKFQRLLVAPFCPQATRQPVLPIDGRKGILSK